MIEATKTKTLVELVLNQGRGSELPRLCIATSGEIAKDPKILTNVTFFKYPGPNFRSYDGTDFRENAIMGNAPPNANAYLGKVSVIQGGVMCGSSYSAVVYFHIDDEQTEKIPKPKIEPRRLLEYEEYDCSCDGEAD